MVDDQRTLSAARTSVNVLLCTEEELNCAYWPELPSIELISRFTSTRSERVMVARSPKKRVRLEAAHEERVNAVPSKTWQVSTVESRAYANDHSDVCMVLPVFQRHIVQLPAADRRLLLYGTGFHFGIIDIRVPLHCRISQMSSRDT